MSKPKEFDLYQDEFGDFDAFPKGERGNKNMRQTPIEVIERSAYDSLLAKLEEAEEVRDDAEESAYRSGMLLAIQDDELAKERAINAVLVGWLSKVGRTHCPPEEETEDYQAGYLQALYDLKDWADKALTKTKEMRDGE